MRGRVNGLRLAAVVVAVTVWPSVSFGASTITGTVTFDGKAPALKPLAMDADPACAKKHTAPVPNESPVPFPASVPVPTRRFRRDDQRHAHDRAVARNRNRNQNRVLIRTGTGTGQIGMPDGKSGPGAVTGSRWPEIRLRRLAPISPRQERARDQGQAP